METQKKIIAVTGSSGLVGSHLLPVLANEGYHLRALSRRLQKETPGITQIQGDIRSAQVARNLVRGCSSVIHLAAVAHTSLRSQAEMDEAQQVNVGGAYNILAAAEDAGIERVLLVSSAHVYARQEGTDLNERSPTAADSFYARTKLMVEQAGLTAAGANRLAVVIARPCLTYGPGVRFNLVSLMRAIQHHYYFHASGEDPRRSFLSVGNAARAIAHLMKAGKSGGIYNLADETPLPLVEFINSLADLMKVSRPRELPLLALRTGVACATPLNWLGCSPLNRESLRKLTVSFSLDVGALAASGFSWLDDGLATRKRMVESYLASHA